MSASATPVFPAAHSHVFLGEGHDANERRTWAVIAICGAMMVLEIVGGVMFGSIALVADGLHMSTHAGALLLAALAYSYARRHASDARFTFGTGKLGDLAGFSSAIVLAMIAVLIGYEAIGRLFAPVPIHFVEAIPIACLGLAVNVASVVLLSGGGHQHPGHRHGADHAHDEEVRTIAVADGVLRLEIHEEGRPPRFRLRFEAGARQRMAMLETERPDGSRQVFAMAARASYLESVDEIPEPHDFIARVRLDAGEHVVVFAEHEHEGHGAAQRDNNMRAAVIHVMADATVSVLVIAGLVLARLFGWLWMDPAAGIVGACVVASWSYALIRDTGALLLDMTPDEDVLLGIRQAVEAEGDRLADLHVWRLGPGHLGVIVSVVTPRPREPEFYRNLLARFRSLSHVTIEIQRAA